MPKHCSMNWIKKWKRLKNISNKHDEYNNNNNISDEWMEVLVMCNNSVRIYLNIDDESLVGSQGKGLSPQRSPDGDAPVALFVLTVTSFGVVVGVGVLSP